MGSRCKSGAAPATVTGDELGHSHWKLPWSFWEGSEGGGAKAPHPGVRRPDPARIHLVTVHTGVVWQEAP